MSFSMNSFDQTLQVVLLLSSLLQVSRLSTSTRAHLDITESASLEQIFKIIQSNHQCSTTIVTPKQSGCVSISLSRDCKAHSDQGFFDDYAQRSPAWGKNFLFYFTGCLLYQLLVHPDRGKRAYTISPQIWKCSSKEIKTCVFSPFCVCCHREPVWGLGRSGSADQYFKDSGKKS